MYYKKKTHLGVICILCDAKIAIYSTLSVLVTNFVGKKRKKLTLIVAKLKPPLSEKIHMQYENDSYGHKCVKYQNFKERHKTYFRILETKGRS